MWRWLGKAAQALRAPTLIVIGGVPGDGKSTVARRLAADLGLPLLWSDHIGQIGRASRGVRAQAALDAYWAPTRLSSASVKSSRHRACWWCLI